MTKPTGRPRGRPKGSKTKPSKEVTRFAPEIRAGEAPPQASDFGASPFDDTMQIRNWWKGREAFWQEKLIAAIQEQKLEDAARAAAKIEYCVCMRLEANKTAMPYAHRKLHGERPRDEDVTKGPAQMLVTKQELSA